MHVNQHAAKSPVLVQMRSRAKQIIATACGMRHTACLHVCRKLRGLQARHGGIARTHQQGLLGKAVSDQMRVKDE